MTQQVRQKVSNSAEVHLWIVIAPPSPLWVYCHEVDLLDSRKQDTHSGMLESFQDCTLYKYIYSLECGELETGA